MSKNFNRKHIARQLGPTPSFGDKL